MSERMDCTVPQPDYLRMDRNGFPGTIDSNGVYDGGDTAAILGTICALEPGILVSTYWLARIAELVSPLGIPRRHPDESKWWGQSDRFSRDQLIPLICSAVRFPGPLVFEVLYRSHKRRYFLTAWNSRKNGAMDAPEKAPDFTGPEIWALWVRYRRPWWMGLVLWFLDLELLGSAIAWKFRKDRVSRNHMLSAITCRRYSPTITSRIAYAITNFPDLIARWRAHCDAVGEFQTADFFEHEWRGTHAH